MRMKWIMALLITFSSLLSGIENELQDSECLALLKNLLLNQATTLSQSKPITFCNEQYSIIETQEKCGSIALIMSNADRTRWIQISGYGLKVQNTIKMLVKKISVTTLPKE